MIGSLRGCYPCILCGVNFLTKQDFQDHLFTCAEEMQSKIGVLQGKLANVTTEFQVLGSEESRRLAGYYKSEIDDLTFRLQLLGMNYTPNGLISPRYSSFFDNLFCPYCCRGYQDQDEYLRHRHVCLRTSLDLKNILHEKIQELSRNVENSPENTDVQAQVKYLTECYAFISFKLNLNDGIPCTEHRL